ncbi:MAG: HAMP domain-containing histidine kinase [Flavobacteriales bacterium]|jgi:signal transduction histidine kinase|nr:MAG: HAMP domain-containing histidine kinase [Flavobacteriales bacterium]
MRLLDRSLLHLSVALLLVLAVWSTVFFFVVRGSVLDSIDEGLEDQQSMILHRLRTDSTLLQVRDLGLHGFAVMPSDHKVKKSFSDTLIHVPSEHGQELVRLMTSGFKHEGRRYRLQVFASTLEEDDLLEDLLWALVGLYLLVLVTIVVVHRLVLRKVWRPFHGILAQLKGFRLGTGGGFAEVPTTVHEFKELNAAARGLVGHANEAYAQQRAFTENAAHELQTPLAIAINKLELLAEEGADEGQRMAAIGEVIVILERLTRLNRSLLLLARIENRQFLDEREVDMGVLAQEVVDEFADLASHRGVEMQVELENSLVWRMDPGLARTLLNNLVKNAIAHNVHGGGVWVQVTALGLRVSNTGADVPLDAARIFDRFHKVTTSTSGTGLGLAIAKAIAGLYGLRLTYHFDKAHHFRLERA